MAASRGRRDSWRSRRRSPCRRSPRGLTGPARYRRRSRSATHHRRGRARPRDCRGRAGRRLRSRGGNRLGRLDLDPPVALEPRRGPDQRADDEVLLEPVQPVDCALRTRRRSAPSSSHGRTRPTGSSLWAARLGDPEDDRERGRKRGQYPANVPGRHAPAAQVCVRSVRPVSAKADRRSLSVAPEPWQAASKARWVSACRRTHGRAHREIRAGEVPPRHRCVAPDSQG